MGQRGQSFWREVNGAWTIANHRYMRPLLTLEADGTGSFPLWLKDLGLRDFLDQYPIAQLIEWGWLVPFRVAFFPRAFLAQLESAEEQWLKDPFKSSRMDFIDVCFHDHYQLLYGNWRAESDETPYWFLPPSLRPNHPIASLLVEPKEGKGAAPVLCQMPQAEDGDQIRYFFEWQAYALIDQIVSSDRFGGIVLNTPDVVSRLRGMLDLADNTIMRSWRLQTDLVLAKDWSAACLGEPMIWLSLYGALRDSVLVIDKTKKNEDRLRAGSVALASYLGVDAVRLEDVIRNRLLVQAQKWLSGAQLTNSRQWSAKAWPYFQRSILWSLEWLCDLSGKSLEHYLDLWRYPTFGYREWAELRKVLPFDHLSARHEFIRYASSHYLKEINLVASSANQLSGEKLTRLVDDLRASSRSFNRFLLAFKEMHDDMTWNLADRVPVEFRQRKPMDQYLLLAVLAEQCLRDRLQSLGQLSSIKFEGMSAYVCKLAASIASERVVRALNSNLKLVNLRDRPERPIESILALNLDSMDAFEAYLTKALLCSILARNYFAHHTYLDVQLRRSKESEYLLGGILVTVLLLAGDSAVSANSGAARGG